MSAIMRDSHIRVEGGSHAEFIGAADGDGVDTSPPVRIALGTQIDMVVVDDHPVGRGHAVSGSFVVADAKVQPGSALQPSLRS